MTTIIENLYAIRAQIDAMISTAQADGSGDKVMLQTPAKNGKPPKPERKKRANAGDGTAWSAFSSKIQKEHKDEVDAVKAEAAIKRKAAKDAGVVVTGFVRMAVGEGIEKATEDFAAEVAKMVQG
jgi:hypothetical protein